MHDVDAFILAGGASRRMGTDKSRLLINGRTFTRTIADTLLNLVDDVTIVGRDSEEPGLKLARDIYPEWGALGGVHAALSACSSEWALIVACDLPFVTAELFTRLASFRTGFDAIVPLQDDGQPQPLCAFYKTHPCLERADELIRQHRRRPRDLMNAVNTRLVDFADVEDLDHAGKFFVNINTPEDYYVATSRSVG